MTINKSEAMAVVRASRIKGQRLQDYGTQQQIKRISKFAADNKLQIVKWFKVSGDKDTELVKILGFCKTHPDTKYLLVTDITRLSRSLGQYLAVKQVLDGVGVTIKVCDSLDYDPPMREFLERLQFTAGRLDSNIRSELTSKRMAQRVSMGYAVTRPPFGYARTLEKGLFKPAKFSETLSTILSAVAFKRISLQKAISAWRFVYECQTGVKEDNRKVLKQMCDPYYAGMLCYKGKKYPGKHKPLISVEQYEAILKLANSLKQAQTEV